MRPKIYRAPTGRTRGLGLGNRRAGVWLSYRSPVLGVCRFPVAPSHMGMSDVGPWRARGGAS